MNKRKVFVLCFFIVVVTLLFNVNNVVKKQSDVSDIDISIKLVSVDVKEGSNVIVDVALSNNSDKSIYNVELLTEAPNENYAQAYGNIVCKAAEEVVAGDSLYLRSVYAVKDDDIESFEGYKVQHRNTLLMIECLVFYLLFVIALLKFISKESKLNIVYLLLIMLCSFGVSILVKEINVSGRNDNIIHSYEDLVEVEIAGKKQYVKVLVNYTTDSLENIIDKNSNGAPDVAEREDFKRDTDGDGLPDFYELYMCGTNPLMVDSQSTGLGDINCDTDEDGLSNLEEYELNCNPLNKDTDYDGLNDSEEFELGTKVLEWDTDGDGMSDGFEIEQDYDPLVKDEKVVVNKELSSEAKNRRNSIKARAEVKTTGDVAESLDISTYETMLVNDKMPGYIGSAFEFIMDDSFESATISFELDDYWFNKKGCEPCIYYFNEDTQLLEELETHIEGNIVSANVEHFSVYVVLNRLEVVDWLYEDIFIRDIVPGFEGEIHNDYISFVVDNSQSMTENDPENEVKSLIFNFVDMLDANDNINLVTFTKAGTLGCDFTDEHDRLLIALNRIVRDSGSGLNSGTDIEAGIRKSLETFTNVEGKKSIVLITDGDIDAREFNKEKLIKEVKSAGVNIYCLHIGNLNSKLLDYICKQTGGRYYLATDIDIVGLSNTFKDLQTDVLEADDSIGDGLTNYEKRLIADGVLKSGTGLNLFEGVDLSLWLSDIDVDKDGLLNGEEVSIVTYNGHVYIKFMSDPFKADTDGDGVLDKKDDAPFTYGLKDGIIGEMYLVAHDTSLNLKDVFNRLRHFEFLGASGEVDTGHSWLVFHNYCDVNFTNKELKEGHYKVLLGNIPRIVTRHNLYPYHLENDSYVSFGYYGESKEGLGENKGKQRWPDNITAEDIGKIVYEQNRLENVNQSYSEEELARLRDKELTEDELIEESRKKSVLMEDVICSDFRINQEFKNSRNQYSYYDGAVAIQRPVTRKELRRFMENVGNVPTYYMYSYNCTNFAIDSWNIMWSSNRNMVEYDPFVFGLPSNLVSELKNKEDVIYQFNDYMYSWWYDMKPVLRFDGNGGLLDGSVSTN